MTPNWSPFVKQSTESVTGERTVFCSTFSLNVTKPAGGVPTQVGAPENWIIAQGSPDAPGQ